MKRGQKVKGIGSFFKGIYTVVSAPKQDKYGSWIIKVKDNNGNILETEADQFILWFQLKGK